MIKNIAMSALAVLFLGIIAVSAQSKKPDYSGTWDLNVSQSKLGDRMRVESMTLTVAQTDKELSVKSATKRAARPEGAPPPPNAGGGDGSGMRRGGGMMGGEVNSTYQLDGKETSVDSETQMGKVNEKLKAAFEADGKLKLTSARAFNTQMGEMTVTTKETWSLSPDGKTLTVKRDTESPRGTNSVEMVFVKK